MTGTGPVSTRDRMWKEAAAGLVPAKSLPRVDERARHIVGSVSLIGAVLSGLGVVAAGQLDRSGPARALAVGSVCLALAAVVTALGSSLLWYTPRLAPGNLVEVERWYRAQFRRAYVVVGAGVLLLLSVAVGGAAAAVLLAGGPAAEPVLAVQVAGVGEDAKLTVRAEFPSVPPGAVLSTEVTGVTTAGVRAVLARGVERAGADGTVSGSVEVPKAGSYSTVEVAAGVADLRCTATLAVGGVSLATVACTTTG